VELSLDGKEVGEEQSFWIILVSALTLPFADFTKLVSYCMETKDLSVSRSLLFNINFYWSKCCVGSSRPIQWNIWWITIRTVWL